MSSDNLIDDYLTYKRNLGYQLRTTEYILRDFASFVQPELIATALTKDNVDKYLIKVNKTYKSVYYHCSALRDLGTYMVSTGYVEAYIVPKHMASLATPEPPYFFTPGEIEAFFRAVDAIKPNNNYKGREILIPAIFRTLYCCGLRCIEVIRLMRKNIHLDDHYFDILESKAHASRRIYISTELVEYLTEFDEAMEQIIPSRQYFFSLHEAGMISENFISINFKRIWRSSFREFPHDFTRPRAYDFRHHFVWYNINNWVKSNIDVNVMIPYLMRYMGHASIKSTLYYFHFVPDFYRDYLNIIEESESIIPEV